MSANPAPLAAVGSPAAPSVPGGRSKRRLGGAIAVVALILAAGAFGYHWWTTSGTLQSTDDAYVGADVTVIGSKVSGYIAQVLVTDNQAVHAGDLLAKLDDRDYRTALDRAKGSVAAQEALLANLDATRRLQEAVILQMRANVAASDAETRRAHDDEVRYKQLSGTAAVSVQSWQKADADYAKAQANTQKAQAEVTAAQRQLDVIDTQKLQARAALSQVLAEREAAELNLAYTEVRAPMDGTVGNRRARQGAFAAAGSQLLSLVPASGLWVDANFKESQVAHMRAGQRVSIEADVMPGRVFHGHVTSLAPATGAQFSALPAENATGNFTKIVQRVPVRIALDEEDGRLGVLRPGLSVAAEVDLRDQP